MKTRPKTKVGRKTWVSHPQFSNKVWHRIRAQRQKVREDPPPSTAKASNMTMNTSCCSKIKAELFNASFFGLDDPSSSKKNDNDEDGDKIVRNQLDLEKSFCTGQHCGSLATSTIKLLIWGIVVSTFIVGWIVDEYPEWFMVYISNWTSVYFCVYMTLSLVLSFLERPSIHMIRAAWVMYNIAATHGLMVIFLYWPPRQMSPEYYPELSYTMVMSHGITCFLVLIDGILINHVPVRLNHYIFIAALGSIYLTWSILQAVLEIDNPIPGPEAIYYSFDWWNAPGQAALRSAITLLLVMPFLNTWIWGLSLCKRHYVVSSCSKEEKEVIDSTRRTQTLEFSDRSHLYYVAEDDDGGDEEEVQFVYPSSEDEQFSLKREEEYDEESPFGEQQILFSVDNEQNEETSFMRGTAPEDEVVILDIEAGDGTTEEDAEDIIHV